MEDDLIDFLLYVMVAFAIVLIIALVVFMIVVLCKNIDNKNCYTETYIEYPCEGATHYARVHRNQNIGCERTKKICEE